MVDECNSNVVVRCISEVAGPLVTGTAAGLAAGYSGGLAPGLAAGGAGFGGHFFNNAFRLYCNNYGPSCWRGQQNANMGIVGNKTVNSSQPSLYGSMRR